MSEEHAVLSPSSAHRWLHCTAAPAAEAQVPNRSSVHADEGTAAHAMAASWLLAATGKPERHEHMLAAPYIADNPSWYLPVKEYVDFVLGLPGELHVEQRVDLRQWIPGGFGTADAVNVAHGTVYVTDLKFGRGVPVYAEGNEQLMLYAAGALHALEVLPEGNVVMTIHQPRIGNISQSEISVRDLLTWAGGVVKKAAQEVMAGGVYRPSEKTCRWCGIKGACAARAADALKTVQQYWSEQ